MKKLLPVLFSAFCFISVYSQNDAKTDCDKVKNTYQVLVESPRIKVAVPSDVCSIVERERKPLEINYYKYSDYITLKIYPNSQLSSLPKELPYIIYKGKE